MPRISVIIPTYNLELYIKEAIDSILNQTYQDFEIIVVDDSTDSTWDIVKSYNNPKIFLIQGERKGISAALNLAMKHAKGEFIARMDGDDISYPERFEKQVKFMDAHPDTVMCGSWMLTSDETIADTDYNDKSTRTSLLFFNTINHPTVMFRREEFIKKDLYYDETLYGCEDQELWQRVLAIYQVNNIPEILLMYRRRPSQNSKNVERDTQILKTIVPPYMKKHLGIDIPKKFLPLFSNEMKKYSLNDLVKLRFFCGDLIESVKSRPEFCVTRARELFDWKLLERLRLGIFTYRQYIKFVKLTKKETNLRFHESDFELKEAEIDVLIKRIFSDRVWSFYKNIRILTFTEKIKYIFNKKIPKIKHIIKKIVPGKILVMYKSIKNKDML